MTKKKMTKSRHGSSLPIELEIVTTKRPNSLTNSILKNFEGIQAMQTILDVTNEDNKLPKTAKKKSKRKKDVKKKQALIKTFR